VAIADLLRTAARPRDLGWRLAGTVLAVPPVRALAWPVYRWVARHRHQLPGGTAACELPAPAKPDHAREHRHRSMPRRVTPR
jgi:predicted DCC family thiol-disulfide oxidoreductase YuxK